VPTHPTPSTLRPTPYTLHPTPHTLHPTPYTPHPIPHTLHPEMRVSNVSSPGVGAVDALRLASGEAINPHSQPLDLLAR
jgi:hypothetical protein